MDLINNQRVGKDIHETFHRELDTQQDKFGVIAEFLGRRLFDKVIIKNIQNKYFLLFFIGLRLKQQNQFNDFK